MLVSVSATLRRLVFGVRNTISASLRVKLTLQETTPGSGGAGFPAGKDRNCSASAAGKK